MLWAACCMAFFGFMRVGEFTIPTKDGYDKGSHISLSDISIDKHNNPRLLRVNIKQSKTEDKKLIKIITQSHGSQGGLVYLPQHLHNQLRQARWGNPNRRLLVSDSIN